MKNDLVDHLEDAAADPRRDPAVVVIIPVFKHSGLLAEAVEAVLAQKAPFPIATVIVDDGCPFPETAEIGQAYAMAHPNVFYVRKPNGGLSSARNYGIDFALRNFPGFEAIYLLDADNRITPNALATLFAFLKERGDIDWVYPNIDKFGIAWSGNYTTDYSRLLHLTFDNICEAGSLVSRRLVASGVRFDETMKAGFEDWDFWLQAIGKGFRGANHPYFGFEYRQRAESMLRDSNRTRENILSYIRQKHKALFETDYLLAAEHDEAPRYAHVGVGTYLVEAFTDPQAPHRADKLDEFVRRFWAARNEPDSFGTPPFLLWMSDLHRQALARLGLVHNMLWLGERLSEQYNFVAIRFETSNAKFEVSVKPVTTDAPLKGKLVGWMTSQSIVTACVDDKSDDWARTLRNGVPSPTVVELVIKAPFSLVETQGTLLSPTNALLATLGALRDSDYHTQRQPQRWNWRQPYLPNRSRYFELLRQALSAGAIMPRLPSGEKKLRIGMLLPVASFGGVEKVAFAMARVLKARGCEVHLFVLGKPIYERHKENDGLFASINFLAADYPIWGGAHTFAGHELLMEGDHNAMAPDLMGLLSGLDVVINNQVASVNAVLGSLRRRGVKIINYIHVLDRTAQGRHAGHPYLALAFEHVYDRILTCSDEMVEWLHSMGVPQPKLTRIDNAPSYALAPSERDKVLEARRQPQEERPLRALFLGRFDSQKGIERLHAVVRHTKRLGAGIDWRIVGRDVLDADAGISWQARFKETGAPVLPPLYAAADLTKAFAWADVVLLPSRWEGAPLTILEAQRLGCVPIATDVGAVNELIEHGKDGLVIPHENDGGVIDGFTQSLMALAKDRDELTRLSDGAAVRAASLDWDISAQPLYAALAEWFPGKLDWRPKPARRLISIRSDVVGRGVRELAG
ncbi:MAG: glycosyltransferase [Candidatus Devosia phytovorans]|uniref:Glycosyltransferase n=1 Tax=Candidatus Devosia phytovorans TaxID=3121372 RepID=A0AAJ6AZB8_9HYPH|nr:glycosyltransferase [Devosia sp.]WEK03636.1 MAG: glycosyltransferase [Devosia sp.]